MDYRNILIVTLIILILAAGYFFYKDVELDPQNAIVSYIEEQSGYEINYSSAKLWPLNEIIIEDLNLVGDSFSLKAAKVNVGYSIFDYFNEQDEVAKIIKYINLDNPNIEYNAADGQTEEVISFSEIKETIFDQVDELYVNIKNGSFILNRSDSNYVINSLDTELKVNSAQQNIKVDVKKGFQARGLILNRYNLQNYSTDNFRISAELNNESWDLYLKNENLSLSQFNNLIQENFGQELDNYNVDNVNGILDLDLHLTGRAFELESYTSNIELTDGGFDFKLEENSQFETIKFSKGSFHLNSNENKVYAEDLQFSINNNDFNFVGLFDLESNSYSGELKSKNFQMDSDYVNNFLADKLDFNLAAEGNINLNIDGNLNSVNLLSNLKLDSLDFRGYNFQDVRAKLRYIDNTVYLDRLKMQTVNEADLEASGLYDIGKESYKLNLSANNIRPVNYLQDEMIRKYVQQYDFNQYLNGQLDFNLSTTGTGDIRNNIVKADLNFEPNRENILRGNGIRSIQAALLYEDDKLFIEDSNVRVNGDSLDLFGQLNLRNNDVYVKLRGNQIELAFLNNYLDLNLTENNTFNIATLIKGKLTDPLIKGDITSSQINYQNYTVNDISVDFSYTERNLQFKNISFNFEEMLFNGSGQIEIDENYNLPESDLNFTLSTDKINYQKIYQYTDQTLPVTGDIEPTVNVFGSLNNLNAEGNFVSQNTEVKLNGRSFALDQVTATVSGSLAEKRIELTNGVLRKDNLHLLVDGTYQDGNMDFNFDADNFAVEELGLIEEASGLFNLQGQLQGNLENPNLSFNFNSENFRYNRFLSDEFTGQVTYNNDTISFKDVKLKRNSSNYLISGNVNDIRGEQSLNLSINTDRGNAREILAFMDYNIPYSVNFPFSGSLKIGGNTAQPEFAVDLAVINNFSNIMEIQGNIAQQIDLTLKGNQVPLSLLNMPGVLETDLAYEGDLNFAGTIQGTRKDFEVNLDTELTELSIIGIQLSEIRGKVSYQSTGRLEFEQTLNQAAERSITADGSLRLNERFIPEIEIAVNNYRLNQIANIDGNINRLSGELDGNMTLRGEMLNPQISGNMDLNLPNLAIEGIADITEVQGQLAFDETKITLNEVTGKFGEGNFQITGNVNYMNQENFWEVRFKGQNFAFNRGSFNGKYNPDIRILNEFRSPLIFGDLRIYDFVVDSELNWPASDSEATAESALFTPQLKLNLIPQKNVFFRSENIDIPVEEGSLQLNYQNEELTFLGDLRSSQGSLDYYNNKFLIDNVTATFEKYSENIPVIHLVGNTVAGGTNIFIYVDGPADNLNISFGSQPELPQDRIIALLTRRGGLSGFTSEDEEFEPGTLVESELYRVVGEQVQLNFIQKVERSLANTLALDRFEIDTYSLAGEREVTVYLGKDLTDEFYVQYTGTFSPEIRDSELTFEYDINKYLNLEGGWYGEDDYRFLLETTIEF